MNRAVWLQSLVAPLWAAVTAFAVWRFLVRFQPEAVGVVLGVAMIAAWIIRARRGRVSDAEAAIRADRLSDAKGLLLTRLETAVGAWELDLNSKVRSMPLPEQAVRRPLSLSLLGVAFLAAVLLVPAPPPRVTGPKNAAAANKLAEVEARAEALSEEEPLEGSLEAELARLREELEENRFDAADWEAADGLDQAIAQKAAEAAEELRKAEEAANALEEAMAKAAEGESAAREQESLERALMEMSDGAAQSGEEALEQMLAQAEKQSGDESGDAASGKAGEKSGEESAQEKDASSGEKSAQQSGDSHQNGKSKQRASEGNKQLSRSKLADVQKALNARQQALQKSFGEQSGEKSASKQPQQSGQGKGEGGKGQGDEEGGDGQGQGEGQGKQAGAQQGGAGVGRGGGKGALSFDDQSEVHPDRLAFEPLPQGQGGDPDELWGLRGVDPKKSSEGAKGNGAGGTAVGDQSPGKRHEQMLPRNRDLVRRYFGGE